MEKTSQIDAALKQTSTAITNFFDSVDKIDRWLYGSKMTYFSWGVVSVLMIAPALDLLLEIPHDRLTFLSTLLFLLFVVLVALAWISSWRDDTGNWTLRRAASRLMTYWETVRDVAMETKTNSQDELLYKLGKYLVFFALAWKASQNLSVFVRKLLGLSGSLGANMRHYERTVNTWYWVLLIAGVGVIYYLHRKSPQVLSRIKRELRHLFGFRSAAGDKYHNEIARIDTTGHVDLVFDAKHKGHVQLIVTNSKSTLFSDFINSLEKWQPENCHYEYEFQDKLYRHLRKTMPEAVVETEKPIGDRSLGNRGRADVVVNDTILIEMKRDTSAGAVQRAKGQIMQYSQIWKDKGPVVLLLCSHEYDHAKVTYTSTMEDLVRLDRSAIAIVAN
jgi:hypothetical protein